MHPVAYDSNIQKSVGAYLVAGLAGTVVVNADEQDALAEMLSKELTFVAFRLADGTARNGKAARRLEVAVITKEDPGNSRLNVLFDSLIELFPPWTSFPLKDFVGGGREVVGQAIVAAASPRAMVEEQDKRRSKTLRVELTYPQPF